jgi:hypothetical protein
VGAPVGYALERATAPTPPSALGARRYEQEELRRVEWMKYYMQPDVAEYDKALELTCTPEEEAAAPRPVQCERRAERAALGRRPMDRPSGSRPRAWFGGRGAGGAGMPRGCCGGPSPDPARAR